MRKLTQFFRSVYLFPLNILMGLASGAISAQGSKCYIGTGTGGAITITAISKAFHGEITGTNTLVKGDRVTFASVGGMIELNTLTGIVQDASSAKFVVDIDTRLFTTWTSGGTATPVVWTQIKDVKSFKPSGSQVSKNDVTNLDSTAKEFVAGLVDNGDFGMSVNYVAGDTGQAACKTAFEASLTKSFKVVAPNNDTFTFSGFVSKFPEIPAGAVDGVLLGDMTIQITGAVVKS